MFQALCHLRTFIFAFLTTWNALPAFLSSTGLFLLPPPPIYCLNATFSERSSLTPHLSFFDFLSLVIPYLINDYFPHSSITVCSYLVHLFMTWLLPVDYILKAVLTDSFTTVFPLCKHRFKNGR